MQASVTTDARSARLHALEQSGWGRPFRLYQPRNLAFWVYALFVASGTIALISGELGAARAYSPALVSGAVWFALLTVPIWWFIRHLDRYTPLSGSLAAAGFAWGGLAATWAFASPANEAMLPLWGKLFGQSFAIDWAPALTAPFTEEFAKAAGFVLLLVVAPRLVRSAFDGLILGAFIGLGFQILEDVSYVWHGAEAHFGVDQGQAAVQVIATRTVVGVASHWLYTALVGAGIVYLIGRPSQRPRRLLGLAFIVAAMVSHGVWDGVAAIAGDPGAVALLIPLTIAVELAIFYVAYRITVRPEREWLRAVLQPEVERDVITPAELTALTTTRKERRAFVRSAGDRRGRTGRRHVLAAGRDLAGALARAGGQDAPQVEFARSEVARVRAAVEVA